MRCSSGGCVFERLLERDEADVVEHDDARFLGILELRQHRDAVRIDGPADEHGVVGVDDRRELRHRFADRRLRAAIEDQPDRALVVVRGDEHDGAVEIRVHDRRRGDQEVAGQGVHGLSLHYVASLLA